MRRIALLLFFLATAVMTFSSCIVHTRRMRPRGRNCHNTCASWAYRQRCARRCSIWRNGACVVYRRTCARTRYCARRVTRCR